MGRIDAHVGRVAYLEINHWIAGGDAGSMSSPVFGIHGVGLEWSGGDVVYYLGEFIYNNLFWYNYKHNNHPYLFCYTNDLY